MPSSEKDKLDGLPRTSVYRPDLQPSAHGSIRGCTSSEEAALAIIDMGMKFNDEKASVSLCTARAPASPPSHTTHLPFSKPVTSPHVGHSVLYYCTLCLRPDEP